MRKRYEHLPSVETEEERYQNLIKENPGDERLKNRVNNKLGKASLTLKEKMYIAALIIGSLSITGALYQRATEKKQKPEGIEKKYKQPEMRPLKEYPKPSIE